MVKVSDSFFFFFPVCPIGEISYRELKIRGNLSKDKGCLLVERVKQLTSTCSFGLILTTRRTVMLC